VTSLDVVALFEAHGARRYGESITQLEHALQCAALARRNRADDEVVVAALLHDIGHLSGGGADAETLGRRGQGRRRGGPAAGRLPLPAGAMAGAAVALRLGCGLT
jgi:HD domain